MLMKSGYKTYSLVVWELDIDEGCRVGPYFLKYIYIYTFFSFFIHVYILQNKPPKMRKNTNPNRWWFVPLISQNLGTSTVGLYNL